MRVGRRLFLRGAAALLAVPAIGRVASLVAPEAAARFTSRFAGAWSNEVTIRIPDLYVQIVEPTAMVALRGNGDVTIESAGKVEITSGARLVGFARRGPDDGAS